MLPIYKGDGLLDRGRAADYLTQILLVADVKLTGAADSDFGAWKAAQQILAAAGLPTTEQA